MTKLDSQKLLTRALPYLISVTLVSLPLYLVRCRDIPFCVSPIPFTLLEVLVLLTFFVWLTSRVMEVGFNTLIGELQREIPLFIQLAILVFLLSGLINAFFSHTQAALGTYKAYFLEPFLFFLVSFDYLRRTKNTKLLVWSLVTCGAWVSTIAIFNLIFHYNPANPAELLERGRASAVYSTSNAVGLLIGPILVLFFGYFLQLKNAGKLNKNENKLTLISLLILLVGLLASGSRGAFGGIFAALTFFGFGFVYFKLNLDWQKIVRQTFIALLGLVFLTIFLFFLNINLITDYSLKNQAKLPINSVSRLCLWGGAVKIIEQQPILGAGLSNFQQAHATNRTCSTENSIYPHNLLLNFWTEVGIFGLVSFLALSLYVFFQLLAGQTLNYFSLGLAAVFVEIFVHGMVDVPYFKNDLSVLFWVILALSLAQILLTGPQKVGQSRPQP